MATDTDILLAKWYEQNITVEELKILQSHYDLASLSNSLKRMDEFQLDVVPAAEGWAGLEKMIERASPTVVQRSGPFGRSRVKFIIWSTVIASLAILSYLYLTKRHTVITNESQSELMYAFSEGSSSLISPGSHIIYDKDGYDENREVTLSGEAFFDVASGEPFSVKTASGLVTVLGTLFDVWQISNHSLRVECYEGRVSVSSALGVEVILATQEAVYIRRGKVEAKTKIDRQEPDWKAEIKHYVGIAVKDLIEDLSRFYEYELILNDIDQSDLFTGVIPINDIEKTCDYLATTLGLTYEKDNNSYTFIRK